jgi:hypothetical protein
VGVSVGGFRMCCSGIRVNRWIDLTTLLLPLIDGSSARSAATADVMMLFGPPTKQPMKARRSSRIVTGMSFMYSANTQRRGQRIPAKVERGWRG